MPMPKDMPEDIMKAMHFKTVRLQYNQDDSISKESVSVYYGKSL